MEEALTFLLASVAGGRRYWVQAPQRINADAGPYIILQRVTGIRDYHMQGPSGFVESRVQCDVYADTYAAAKQTARELIAALSGFSGTVGGVVIQGIMIDSERDLPAADAGEVSHLFRTSVDVFVYHNDLWLLSGGQWNDEGVWYDPKLYP